MQLIGTDIIEISRITDAINKFGDAFLNRIYTQDEVYYFKTRPPSLAARFAGKEAVFKALNYDILYFQEIEILCDNKNRPTVKLYGKTKEHAELIGIKEIDISLSHSKEFAIACVVCQ